MVERGWNLCSYIHFLLHAKSFKMRISWAGLTTQLKECWYYYHLLNGWRPGYHHSIIDVKYQQSFTCTDEYHIFLAYKETTLCGVSYWLTTDGYERGVGLIRPLNTLLMVSHWKLSLECFFTVLWDRIRVIWYFPVGIVCWNPWFYWGGLCKLFQIWGGSLWRLCDHQKSQECGSVFLPSSLNCWGGTMWLLPEYVH